MLTLSDDKIQEYVDGRLSVRERAAVAAILSVSPQLRREVTELVLVNEMVRVLGQDILDEPVPERLTDVLKTRASVNGRSLDV